jgi:hypothetical protein
MIRRTSAVYVARISADSRLSADFASRICYAFAPGLDAIQIPQLYTPGKSLTSVFQSISSLIRHGMNRRNPSIASLPLGVAVRTTIVRKGTPTQPVRTLSDDFALLESVPAQLRIKKSLVAALVVMIVFVLIVVSIASTPPDTLLFLAVLAGIVLWVSAATTIMNLRAYRWQQKIALIVLTPFYPLYFAGATIRSLLQK